MSNKNKRTKNKVNEIISWVFLIIMLIFFGLSAKSVLDSKKSGEDAYVLGYRLVYISSGSMEPTMKTNGMALAKKVESIDDIKEGDIISFGVLQNNGSKVRVTHRVDHIQDGLIYTKGDNNRIIDSFPTTEDDLESKVVAIFNFTAGIVNMWESGSYGKLIILSIALGILIMFVLLETWLHVRKKRKQVTNKGEEE